MKSPSKSLAISPSRGPALKVRPPSFRALPCIPLRGFPCTPFSGASPDISFSGYSPVPFFRALPCGGYPQTPSQALPATVSSYPTLSYRKRGLRTTLQTSRQSLAGGLIDSESWLSPSKFWYRSRAFALPGVTTPSRVRHVFFYADYAKRWSATALGS